jgi:hypothetical protein
MRIKERSFVVPTIMHHSQCGVTPRKRKANKKKQQQKFDDKSATKNVEEIF